jgi:hypothetical protein
MMLDPDDKRRYLDDQKWGDLAANIIVVVIVSTMLMGLIQHLIMWVINEK